jgi:shikimate kinase
VSEIFAADTEAGFRDLERDVVGRVAREDGIVIALGGGAVLDPRNVEDAKRGGVIYYLEVTPEEVASRSEGTGVRPLLEGKGTGDIARLMEGRERYYLEAADVTVAAAGRDPGEVASEIISDFEARTLVDDDS